MSIEIDNFDPIQEKLIRQREPKLNSILEDTEIFAIERDDTRKFAIKYRNGQIFRCSGPLADRGIKVLFQKENIKKRKLF